VASINLTEVDEAILRQAFDNATELIDFDLVFPENIFLGKWSTYVFCESDRIFSKGFMPAMAQLLHLEQAHAACLLNLDRTKVFEFEKSAAMFVDETNTENQYWDALKKGGVAEGWLYVMERYVCTSEVGEWCIYCERNNDIAVVGLREKSGLQKFKEPLNALYAKPLEDLIAGGSSSLFPFNRLPPLWRDGLLKCYQHTNMISEKSWPKLESILFIAGRPATKQDVEIGSAAFVAEKDGVLIGKPIDIPLPQYAFFKRGTERIPVIVIQAEEAQGRQMLGAKLLDGEYLVGTMTEFQLFDNTPPSLNQLSESIAAPLPYKQVGRNDPCPCGSGKRYKQCHGSLQT